MPHGGNRPVGRVSSRNKEEASGSQGVRPHDGAAIAATDASTPVLLELKKAQNAIAMWWTYADESKKEAKRLMSVNNDMEAELQTLKGLSDRSKTDWKVWGDEKEELHRAFAMQLSEHAAKHTRGATFE